MTRGKASALDEALAFAKAHKPPKGPRCGLCLLPKEDREIAAALRAEGTEYSVVTEWLRQKRGHMVTKHQVTYHLRQHVERG